jgi:hypothetical protein
MIFHDVVGVLWRAAVVCAAVGGVLAGCGSDPSNGNAEPKCLAKPVDGNCTDALYGLHNGVIAPTFDDVFTNTLSKKCGVAGCHAPPHPQHGLELDDVDIAYQDLVQTPSTTGDMRIIGGNLQCGKALVRLETPNESYSMPPGDPLTPQELCSIVHWIENGAKR